MHTNYYLFGTPKQTKPQKSNKPISRDNLGEINGILIATPEQIKEQNSIRDNSQTLRRGKGANHAQNPKDYYTKNNRLSSGWIEAIVSERKRFGKMRRWVEYHIRKGTFESEYKLFCHANGLEFRIENLYIFAVGMKLDKYFIRFNPDYTLPKELDLNDERHDKSVLRFIQSLSI